MISLGQASHKEKTRRKEWESYQSWQFTQPEQQTGLHCVTVNGQICCCLFVCLFFYF